MRAIAIASSCCHLFDTIALTHLIIVRFSIICQSATSTSVRLPSQALLEGTSSYSAKRPSLL